MIIGKNILVIVAHSDDETIGMGGTIRKHVLAGDKVHVVAMTNGVGARELTNKQVVNKSTVNRANHISQRGDSGILGVYKLKQYVCMCVRMGICMYVRVFVGSGRRALGRS